MTVTALIVSWNSAPDLPACLGSVPSHLPVLVVDNGSSDTSVQAARDGGAEVIELGSNLGFPHAVNVGLATVETPYVLLLNPDVVIAPGAVERCITELDQEPEVAIVGPNTRLPDGRPEPPAARRDRTALQIVVESTGLVHLSRRFDLQMIHERDVDQDVEAVNGAFMVVRTQVLQSMGGLDESVFMYFEDQDLCRRVRDHGLRVRYVAEAHAVHGNGTSTARGDNEQRARAYVHRIDADLEFLRRYRSRGSVRIAILAFAVRALVGLVVSLVRPTRRLRYRVALTYALRQLTGRRPAPAV